MWLKDLYDTYEMNISQVGVPIQDQFGNKLTLLPISHMYQNFQVQVNLTKDGNFESAKVLGKGLGNTIIPATIESASRSNSPEPHALHDNLQYVAKDFEKYGGKPKVRKLKSGNKTSTELYFQQLEAWCSSPYGHPRVKVIQKYLEKGTVIQDLLNAKILVADEEGKLLSKWQKGYETESGEKPEIFKALAGDQFSTFVRFDVYDESDVPIWDDVSIRDSFIKFYSSKITETGLCYVTGKTLPLSDKHASKIRYGGDMAKLISANDEAGFTFRGRFQTKDQAVTISYEASQKGLNALKWLIGKQGTIRDGRVFLLWGNRVTKVIDCAQSMLSQMEALGLAPQIEKNNKVENGDTFVYDAVQFRKALDSQKHNKINNDKINILILDAATPGRMSVIYYRNFENDVYLDRIEKWHDSCRWEQRYRRDNQTITFVGAPSLFEIAKAAYGNLAKDSLVNETISRILPCVIDQKKLPRDLLENIVDRASRPLGEEEWEWKRNLSIACALVNRACHDDYYDSEMFSITLDEQETNRSYLFGRLLAISEFAETTATDANFLANALRYMDRYRIAPAKTWMILQEKMLPYLGKHSDSQSRYLMHQVEKIAGTFKIKDFSNEKLDGRFLIGYYVQRKALYTPVDSEVKVEKKTIERPVRMNSRSYQFGSLLGTADYLERNALYKKSDVQDSNKRYRLSKAQQSLEIFSRTPAKVWQVLQGQLIAYEKSLRGSRLDAPEDARKFNYLKEIIALTGSELTTTDFQNQLLSHEFLLGYYHQDYNLRLGQLHRDEYVNLLDLTNTDPSYLLGRYLGYLDMIEEYVLDDEPRETNTLRYLNTFSNHASRGLANVERLYPVYEKKASQSYSRWLHQIIEEKHVFKEQYYELFNQLEQASPLYLLGYYQQYTELKNKKYEKDVE